MSIIDIIFKKSEREDNSQALVGTEIKLRRNALSKTLEEVSCDTCSVSYLSKVENCEIKPNPAFLEEICKRVNLSTKNIRAIRESKEIFQKTIVALYKRDEKVINEVYEQVFDLKNYRAKMVKLTYSLYHENIRVAKRLIGELGKVEASMQLNDLIILAYLEARYHYLTKNYYDSFALLKPLIRVTHSYAYLDSLCLELMTLILYDLNSQLFIDYSNHLKTNYLSHNSFEKVKGLEEKILRYYLNNGYLSLVSERLLELSYELEKTRILYSAYSGESLDITYEELSYEKMIYAYTTNRVIFNKLYETQKIDCTELEQMVISFLYDKDSEESYKKIEDIYFPYAMRVKNYFFLKTVVTTYVRLLKENSRYKKCVAIIEEYRKLEKERENFC